MKTVPFHPFSRRANPRGMPRSITSAVLAGFCLLAGAMAQAANVPVPNGDFSSATNVGSIGGGLLGASGTDVVIGEGPWTGTYNGLLGLLAPPQLTISSGQAAIGGLAGINVLGLLYNGGYFSQTLAQGYTPGQRYTVSARVDIGTVLDLGVLDSANVGLALRSSDGTTLASTATAPPELVTLVALGGTEYLLTLAHDVMGPVNGTIDVQLLGTPNDLIGIGLLTSVTYRHVALDATAIDPVAGTVVGVEGTVQSATVATAFEQALGVQVLDGNGDPVPNVEVRFEAPAGGASAVLSATTVLTNAAGIGSIDATANTIAGGYTISASVTGVSSVASYALVNTADVPASVNAVGPGAEQITPVSTPFDEPLLVAVADQYGNPASGAEVTFVAPTAGASATLSASTATTDASGLAQVDATANAVIGSYAVVAQVAGVATTTSFALTNSLEDGTTIDDTSGGGGGQSAEIGSAFRCALEVAVARPDGTPYAGLQVRFDAPATGASSQLFDGTNSGASLSVATAASGKARVQAIANDIEGEYQITAELVGAGDIAPVTFVLRNIGSLIYADGFDTPCSPFQP